MNDVRDLSPLPAPTPLVRFTLGGSTIAAAAGIDPYLSRVGLFLRLKGLLPDPESEAIEWGKRLEPFVLAEIDKRHPLVTSERIGAGVETAESAYRDRERPWLVGHPGGRCVIDGTVGVAEAKTTNRWARSRTDDVPLTWQAQVQTYMRLTDTDRAVIGALVDGQRFELAIVERNDVAMARLLERADEFYGMLQRDELPPFVGHQNEADAVKAIYPDAQPARTVRASKRLRAVVDELRMIREAEDATKRERERLESIVKASMGNAAVLIGAHDETLVTWKNTPSRRLDTKALRESHPDLYDEFTNETNTRRFLLS